MYSKGEYLFFKLLNDPIRNRISFVCSRDCKLS